MPPTIPGNAPQFPAMPSNAPIYFHCVHKNYDWVGERSSAGEASPREPEPAEGGGGDPRRGEASAE